MSENVNKHAYLIIAHNQFELLRMLLKLLDDKRHDFYIHIDKSVQNFDFDDIRKCVTQSEITFVDRHNITWGGFSQIQSEMTLLKAATKNKYSYYHLLSGVDMPLKTADEIYNFFEQNSGYQFIHFNDDEFTLNPRIQQRVRVYHPTQERFGRKSKLMVLFDRCLSELQCILKIDRWKNNGLEFKSGYNWFSITHEIAEYIASSEDLVNRYFKSSICADEVFLQTLVFNKFGDSLKLYKSELGSDCRTCARYIDWKRGSPYVFRNSDFDEMINSGCMFARKLDLNVDKEICYRIYDYLKKSQA